MQDPYEIIVIDGYTPSKHRTAPVVLLQINNIEALLAIKKSNIQQTRQGVYIFSSKPLFGIEVLASERENQLEAYWINLLKITVPLLLS